MNIFKIELQINNWNSEYKNLLYNSPIKVAFAKQRNEICKLLYNDERFYFGICMPKDCQKVTEIVVPPTVTVIGERCFQNCYFLTKVTLPQTLQSIDRFAFCGCVSLKEIKNTEHNYND